MAQSDERVDPHGAPRGKITGGEAGERHYGDHRRERRRVARRDAPKLRGDGARRRKRPRHPEDHAGAEQLPPIPSTIRSTSRRPAPSAIRTPISCVCRETVYAITLNTPSATSTSPTPANTPISTSPKRGSA